MLSTQLLLAAGLVAAAYLGGSIPFSLLVARACGVDLRQVGSGNVGGANVWRSCGFGPFVVAATLDMLKGMLPTLAALWRLSGHPIATIAVGLAAVLGHTFSVFLSFKGGKAVATSSGVLAAIAPLLIPFGLAAWALAFLITRISSVASLSAAAVVTLAALAFYLAGRMPLPYAIFIWGVGALIVYLHRANIQRLIAGTENRFGRLF